MPTLREYFVSESTDYFGQLNEQLNRLDGSRGDPQELLRLSRGLRGSAHLARERSEEHTSELQSQSNLVCRLLLDPATTELYTLSLHDALPISHGGRAPGVTDADATRVLRLRIDRLFRSAQ